MRIPLDDLLWDRLYGPYGVEPVAPALAALSEVWDAERASDLFWEKLFHQETLYPVTYAALPWLWHLAGTDPDATDPEARADILSFLSIVMQCALERGEGLPDLGAPQGLSPVLTRHQKDRLTPANRLRAEDMAVLARQRDWTALTSPAIADACVAAVAGADPVGDGYLLFGPLCLEGG